MSLSRQLIKGMQHIHRNRVAHRDVKPQNLLFSRNGQQIKVSDFGISKEIRPGRSATQRTSHAEGTLGFASPETYLSDIISMSADIYSLAITLHILWSNGCHPFGVDPDLWIYNIKKNRGRDFSGLLFSEEMAAKKAEFVDLLKQMLQFDPKLRPTIDQVLKHPFFSKTGALEGSVADEASLETEVAQEPVLQTPDEAFSAIEETIPKQVSITDEASLETELTQDPVLQTTDKTFSTIEETIPKQVTSQNDLSSSVSTPTAGEPSCSSHIDQPSLGAASRNDGKMRQRASNQPQQPSPESDEDAPLPSTDGARAQNTTASLTAMSWNAGLDAAVEDPSHRECEKAEALIKDSKFEEAVSILEYLPPSPRQQLLLIDCYSQLGRVSQLCIETMQMLMAQHPSPNAGDFLILGVKYFESQAYIRALIFLSCASKLYKLDHTSNPNHALRRICVCSWRCYQVIGDMAEQGGRMLQLANDFGIYVITQILADYRSIPNGDPAFKIKYECYCLYNIGLCYRVTKQHQKSIESYKLGIETMKRHFGEKASSFYIFGWMIHNLGWEEFNLGNYIEAEKYFSEALKALKLAADFLNKEEKKKSIQLASNKLKEVRERLGKT